MFVLEPLGLTGRLIHYSTPVRVSLLGGAQRAEMAPVTSKALGQEHPPPPRCTTKGLIVPGHHSNAEGDWKE